MQLMTGTGSFFEFTALVGLSSGNSFSDSLKALIIVFTAVFIFIDGYSFMAARHSRENNVGDKLEKHPGYQGKNKTLLTTSRRPPKFNS